jgi:alkaline phosphatase
MKLGELKKQFKYTNDGHGKNLSIYDVDEKELIVGIAVEKEHSKDLNVRTSIAIDHLADNKKYYTLLVESGIVDEKEALDLAKKYLKVEPKK